MQKPVPGFPSPFFHSTKATRRRERLARVLGCSAALFGAAAYYVLICFFFA
jgi:hypothetical protein